MSNIEAVQRLHIKNLEAAMKALRAENERLNKIAAPDGFLPVTPESIEMSLILIFWGTPIPEDNEGVKSLREAARKLQERWGETE